MSKDVRNVGYLINVERFEDITENDLDEWIYLLKRAAVRDDFHSPNIDRARRKLALMKMTPDERLLGALREVHRD